ENRREVGGEDRRRVTHAVLIDETAGSDFIQTLFDPAGIAHGRPAEGIGANQQGFGVSREDLLFGLPEQRGFAAVAMAGAPFFVEDPGAGEDRIAADVAESAFGFTGGAGPEVGFDDAAF